MKAGSKIYLRKPEIEICRRLLANFDQAASLALGGGAALDRLLEKLDYHIERCEAPNAENT